MLIKDIQYQHRNNGNQFSFDADFRDDGKIDIGYHVVQFADPRHTPNGSINTVTFDAKTMKPLLERSGDGIVWEITEVAKGHPVRCDGKPSFRHIITKHPQSGKAGESTDFRKDSYADVMAADYDMLSLAIDRLPEGEQKKQLDKIFSEAAYAMGYSPLGNAKKPGIKIENILQTRGNTAFNCSVDFRDRDIVLDIEKPYGDLSLTDRIIFDAKTLLPTKLTSRQFDDFIDGVGDVTSRFDITQLEGAEPSFRVERKSQEPAKTFKRFEDQPAVKDYPAAAFAASYEVPYAALKEAIDRLPGGAQKVLLERQFAVVAKELDYKTSLLDRAARAVGL